MKSRALIFLALLGLFWACEEIDKPLSTKTTEPNYFPLTTGSFWVYNCYEIDSLGHEVLKSENDTVEIIGDTVLANGETYQIFYGKRYMFLDMPKDSTCYRDSLGYIVNAEGRIKMSYKNFNDTLYQEFIPDETNMYYKYSTLMEEYGQPVDLVSGVFDSVLNCAFHVDYFKLEEPFGMQLENLYAPNIGKILSQNCYLSGYIERGLFYETRLVDYHIEP